MVDVLLIHLVAEYMIQPESWLAMKRAPRPRGFAVLLAHVSAPVIVCAVFGLMTPWQSVCVAALHALVDGPLGPRLVVASRVQSVYRSMSASYEDWPQQVQALEFALSATSEKFWYFTAHLASIWVGMRIGGLI